MNKNLKSKFVIATALLMVIIWVYIIVTSTKDQNLNYWWGSALAIFSIVYGLIGMSTAKKWSWLKSGVGSAIFFISLGVILWGIGQAGWMYYVFKYPDQQVVESKLLDLIFLAAVPIWTVGIYKLSKATGVKYALKGAKAKLIALAATVVLAILSYYLLIVVARGGLAAIQEQNMWTVCIDFLLTIGSAVNLILISVIFGFSWKMLGGRFKNPIKTILVSFLLMYIADFLYAYLSGKELYYNGDISDFLYLIAITTMCTALCLLDPSSTKQILDEKQVAQKQSEVISEQPNPTPQTTESENTTQEANQQSNAQFNNVNQEET